MQPIVAFLIVAAVFAIGDIISVKTKAIVSSLFVASLIMSEAAKAKGMPNMAIFATLILVIQGFFGYLILPLTAVIMANLSKATPEVLASLIAPVLISLILGIIGIVVFSIVVGRILGLSPEMSLAIGCTCLFGFPGTFIVSQEAARAIARDEEERQYILDRILPKMLVAGFTTVTVASVVLAGIFAKMV